MFKKNVIGLFMLGVCHTAGAFQYTEELSGQYSWADPETGNNPRAAEISVRHYFSPVLYTDKPWAESAFIGRNSSVEVLYYDAEDNGPNAEYDSDGVGVIFDYIDAPSGWFLNAAYSRGDQDTKNSALFSTTKASVDIDDYTITVGKYISAATRLSLFYGVKDSDTDRIVDTNFGPLSSDFPYVWFWLEPGPTHINFPRTITEIEEKKKKWGLGLRHFASSSTLNYAVSANVVYQTREQRSSQKSLFSPFVIGTLSSISGNADFVELYPINPIPFTFRSSTKESGIWVYQLSGTVYPCERLGIGLGYSKTDSDGLDIDEASFTAEWFITEAISLSGSYTYSRSEISGIGSLARFPSSSLILDTDSYVLRLTGRF